MSSEIMNMFDDALNLDPIHFIEHHRKVKGKNFKILGTGREYLIELYRYACIGCMKDKRPVVIVKGRQVEMTETALNISLYFLKNFHDFTVLHAFPRSEQVSRYSKDRLSLALKDSIDGKLEKLKAKDMSASDTVSAKNFINNNIYYMYSAWGDADAIRGIPADLLSRDEFQDWTDNAIANTDSCLTASDYGVEFSFGTPKLVGSAFERLWNSSDQRYYHLRCIKCSSLFRITLDNFVGGHDGFQVECPSCKERQDKRAAMRNGQWIPTKKGEFRVGFHVSQLLSPRVKRNDITKRQSEYSEARFKNEVLGEFYSGAGAPLEYSEVVARCAEPYSKRELSPMIVPPKQTFMGLDWGGRNEIKDKGAYTVVTIISKDKDKYNLEYTERIMTSDIDRQVQYITELIRLYNCVNVVADSGFGQYQCQKLQKIHADKVKACWYSNNIKNKIKYDKDTWILSIDRSAWLEELIEIVKRGNLCIPWAKPYKVDWFIKHMCNTELRYSNKNGNVTREYEKLNTQDPNDGLHSLNYAYIASVVHLGESGLGSSPVGNYGQGLPKPVGTSFTGKPSKGFPNNFPAFPSIRRR